MKTIYVLNGPARSGKDTIANLLSQQGAEHYKFSRVLKDMTHRHYGLDARFDTYEKTKDEPHNDFGGLSPREAYIERGDAIRERFGPEVFGNHTALAIKNSKANEIVISDLASYDELKPVTHIENAKVVIVRLHRDGKDFTGDCRSYVKNTGLIEMDIKNNGSIKQLQNNISAMRNKVDNSNTISPLTIKKDPQRNLGVGILTNTHGSRTIHRLLCE